MHAGEESDAYCCKTWSCLDWPNWLIKCALMLYALGLTEAWTLFGEDSSVVSLSRPFSSHDQVTLNVTSFT